MTKQAITVNGLKRRIYSQDFYKYSELATEGFQSEVLQSAFRKSLEKEQSFEVLKLFKNNKTCYSVKDYADILLCRHISDNVRLFLTGSKSRVKIQRQLMQHLREGTNYRVYRLDIKSFYESLSIETIASVLDKSPLSYQTKNIIYAFIRSATENSGSFLPRGIQFSPALSEMMLQDFDDNIRLLDGVFFYSRYVDDIIIITSGFEDKTCFIKKLRDYLPVGLSFNYNKQKVIDAPKKGHNGSLAASFDYLGYQYNIYDPLLAKSDQRPHFFRRVNVTLSKSKVSKLKTRISRSFEKFRSDKNFDLLRDRIHYLTSNRLMKDKKSGRLINTGIYYNHVNLASDDKNLIELDKYLFSRIHKDSRFNGLLSSEMKRTLSTFSFTRGYASRIFKRFSPNKLAKIKDSWRY